MSDAASTLLNLVEKDQDDEDRIRVPRKINAGRLMKEEEPQLFYQRTTKNSTSIRHSLVAYSLLSSYGIFMPFMT